MTLLELLVQELPKGGGWPDNKFLFVTQDGNGNVWSYPRTPKYYPNTCIWGCHGGDGRRLLSKKLASFDFSSAIITREQYEAALAASKQPEWDGEDLPPVGCECMVKGEIRDDNFYKCKILNHTIFRGIDCAVFQTDKTVSVCSAKYFRPIRTEAERKREEAAKSMLEVIESQKHRYTENAYMLIYDAIAAGKIPGVKLAD